MQTPASAIGTAKGAPLHLLSRNTPDCCERILWGDPVRDPIWRNPQYLNPEAPWGTAFDPDQPVGSIGFFDVTTQCPRPQDPRLEGYLLRVRIGIAPHLRGRGYGVALHKLCEQYAQDLGMLGVAALNPHEKFGDVFDDYRAFTDSARRRWMKKTF